MPKIESEKIDCLHRPCSRPAPRGKIKSVRTHSEVIEQVGSFSLLKLLFLVRNWHCWLRKACTRQMTPQIREETAKTAVFDSADRHEKLYGWSRLYASAQGRHETGGVLFNFAFFESFLWHFNKKQYAEVIFRLSRPVLCKNQENGSGKQWSLHAPLKGGRQVVCAAWRDLGPSYLIFVFLTSHHLYGRNSTGDHFDQGSLKLLGEPSVIKFKWSDVPPLWLQYYM